MARPETVGKRLKRLREAAGLSQRQLACKGVTPAYISRIEAGDRRPSLYTLQALARELDVPWVYLLTGEPYGVVQVGDAAYVVPAPVADAWQRAELVA